MKQAFLITAYKDFDWIMRSVDVYRTRVDCYIHVDKKVTPPDEFWRWAKQARGVSVFSKFKINWGSYKHISAALYLLQVALDTDAYDYFHILSANTTIVKPLDEVLDFFEKNPETSYAEVLDLQETDPDGQVDKWFRQYHFLHWYDKQTNFGRQADWYLGKLQTKLGVERNLRYRYKGFFYAHYAADFMRYVLTYVKAHPEYLRRLKYCHVPEEFFFQNILMASPFRERFVNDHLFYTKWETGGLAGTLNLSDERPIKEGAYLFARKVGADSEALIQKLGVF